MKRAHFLTKAPDGKILKTSHVNSGAMLQQGILKRSQSEKPHVVFIE
jgi:hypothetical protein